MAPQPILGPVPCPRPVSQVIQGASSAPTPDASDLPPNTALTGYAWNQTARDKVFAHTFHFAKEVCCLMTRGTLVVTVKALDSGPAGSATSANGATKVLTFTVPASALSLGRVSLLAQDDTAIVSADLRLEGCCIR